MNVLCLCNCIRVALATYPCAIAQDNTAQVVSVLNKKLTAQPAQEVAVLSIFCSATLYRLFNAHSVNCVVHTWMRGSLVI